MAKNITKGDLRKQDFLVLKQSRDDTVTKVVAPNGLQIGLSDSRFKNPLTVKGGINVTEEKPYLRAGANILLETDEDGQITVATTTDSLAVKKNKQQYTITTGPFNPGIEILLGASGLNSIGVRDTDDYIDVFHNNQLMMSGTVAAVTAGTADYYIKPLENKIVFGFKVLNNDTIITSVISSGSANVAAAGDALSLSNNAYNVNVSAAGGLQINSDALSLKLKANSALNLNSNGLSVDINGLTNLGTDVVTSDFVLVYDTTAGTIKKVSVGNIQGAGATIDIAGVSNSLTETTLATGDLFAVADVDAANETKKITVQDFAQFLADGTNAGIAESSGKLSVDLNDLSSGAVTVSEDSIVFIDLGDNATKKESIVDFSSALAGSVATTGLASSAGHLKIDIANVTSVGTLNSADQVLIYDSDVGALRKTTINDISIGAAAPPGAQYVTLDTDGTLSNERVLTAGDGLSKTDNGAGSTVVLDVDVTDLIDTGHGLKETSNNIQLALKSSAGLAFHSDGTLMIDYGSNAGQAAQGSNDVNIIAGDGLRTGGSFKVGAASSTVQLDIDPADFAGPGLVVDSNDLRVSIGAGDNVTIVTGSDGSFIISSSLPVEGQFNAGDGLDLVGQTFSADLKSGGGLVIDNTEIAVLVSDLVGNGLQADGSGNFTIKPDSTTGPTNVPVQVSSQGVSVLIDNATIEQSSGALRVKDGSIGNSKLANSEVTVTAGGGLLGGGAVSLGSSVTLHVDVSDFAGNGLKDVGSEVMAIDDTIVATLSGSVFSGHVGVTGSIHSTTEISGSLLKASKISGSLTTLENGDPYLLAGPNITLATGSSGAITISAAADPDVFKTISVAGQDDVVADASTDTLTLAAGSNVTITTDASSDTITIASTDTNTEYTAGDGLDLTSTTFSLDLKTGSGLVIDSTELSIDDSVIATLSGSVFSGHVGVTGSIHSTSDISGSVVKASSLSGSLTTLENGSPYLVAGSNITLVTGSSGAITITSAAGGGSISVLSGSTTISDTTSLAFGSGFIVNENSSGVASVTASIGAPEDGLYSDGLFTDFGPTTGIGVAIDRFNEVLKGLAPSAAPDLDDVNCADTGTTSKLSFGSSQSISGYTNVTPASLSPSSNFSNVDINGTYNSSASSNDLRRSVFNGSTVINGTLNADVGADSPNHAAGAFGDGNQGTLKLFVNNNSTPIHSVDLSSFGSGNSLNGNGSGFNLSAVTNGAFSDGSTFSTFKHRTGTYKITAADQRNGWNYARITHTVGSSVKTTNYIEWVNDSNSNALTAAGSAFDTLNMSGTK